MNNEYDTTLDEYYEGVVQAFENWLNCHTDKDGWEEGWLGGYLPSGLYHEATSSFVAGCARWGWDILKDAIKRDASVWTLYSCTECGDTYLDEDDECSCDDQRGMDTFEEHTAEDVVEWYEDLGIDPSDAAIDDCFYEYAHGKYLDWLSANYSDTLETIQEGYKRLTEYDDPYDLIATLLYVTTVQHGGGVLLEDYNYDLSCELVDQVRDNGLSSVWTREEINEFLDERKPICSID